MTSPKATLFCKKFEYSSFFLLGGGGDNKVPKLRKKKKEKKEKVPSRQENTHSFAGPETHIFLKDGPMTMISGVKRPLSNFSAKWGHTGFVAFAKG